MSNKSRIVMVAGSASHGGGSHEHPAGCALFADLLNKHVEGVEAAVFQGWPEDPELSQIQMQSLFILMVVLDT